MINQIYSPLKPIAPIPGAYTVQDGNINTKVPTFLDVFKSLVGETAAAQEQKAKDILDVMLGDADDLERIQPNIAKAQISLELLTNVRNATLDSYNEIIKMSI
ncbi:MAG: flagellar hook-basal body complex protein FliE [Oscillospiraceae bacterium]|nr:flagellar hook-basal body complex protein FliE [Oscillospiraceae bacterium]